MVTKDRVEKCLRPIWQDIIYLAIGKRFATVKVRFKSEKIARHHSTTLFKTDEVVLLPTYLGRRNPTGG